MSTSFRHITAILICVLATLCGGAQERMMPSSHLVDSAARISLITCAPGSDIYELEGHSGLRLQYAGADVTANWGVFDFQSPGFVYRFVKGETDYMVDVVPSSYFILSYRMRNRAVVEQVLNLSTEQKRKVVDLVIENLRPENRVYRYNYVKDNCATRPLDIVEHALADSIILSPASFDFSKPVSFRSMMRSYHANYPWYQFGIDLALGSGIDYAIEPRDASFAPVELEAMAADATIATSSGSKPLVLETNILAPGNPAGIALGPTPFYATPLAATIALLIISLSITYVDNRRRGMSRWFDALLFGFFGLLGCVVAFLVFVSVHEATAPNYVLLWLNPLWLLVAVLIWSKRCRRPVGVLMWLYIIGAAAFACIALLGVQSANTAFWPMLAAPLVRAVYFLTYHRRYGLRK